MRFLKDCRGNEVIEYVALGAVLVVLVVSALWTIGRNAQTQGNGVASYIDAINVPSHP